MPGEKKVIQIELEDADTRGEKPKVEIEGLTPLTISESSK
jgi:hypothetical protein